MVFLSVCVDVRLVFVCECRQKGDVDNKVSWGKWRTREREREREREKRAGVLSSLWLQAAGSAFSSTSWQCQLSLSLSVSLSWCRSISLSPQLFAADTGSWGSVIQLPHTHAQSWTLSTSSAGHMECSRCQTCVHKYTYPNADSDLPVLLFFHKEKCKWESPLCVSVESLTVVYFTINSLLADYIFFAVLSMLDIFRD